jgi:hypothetical protein
VSWWHTAGMTNPAPGNPRPQKPRFGEIWFDDAGEMLAWDGSAWVLYEDLESWPGGDDADPFGVMRDI